MKRLLKLAKILRNPENGCPWDCAQTFDSFKQCLVEEAGEVVEAIEKKDFSNLREELGDTLFNIVFLINLAEEKQIFTMDDVIEKVYHKLIERHPHVFGHEKAENASEALKLFRQAKNSKLISVEAARQDAWDILCRYTLSDNLRKHALGVEAIMAAYAVKYGENEEKWRIVGLLHDLDYEQFPDKHPLKCISILKEIGYNEDIQRAILCHVGDTGFLAKSPMEKTLCAVDELCGFIVAVALVRPSKKIQDVSVKSVKKKLKDKAFARSVDRDSINKGSEMLKVSLEEHISFSIEALKSVASQLGL